MCTSSSKAPVLLLRTPVKVSRQRPSLNHSQREWCRAPDRTASHSLLAARCVLGTNRHTAPALGCALNTYIVCTVHGVCHTRVLSAPRDSRCVCVVRQGGVRVDAPLAASWRTMGGKGGGKGLNNWGVCALCWSPKRLAIVRFTVVRVCTARERGGEHDLLLDAMTTTTSSFP